MTSERSAMLNRLSKWELYELRDEAAAMPYEKKQRLDTLLDFYETTVGVALEAVALQEELECVKDELKECEDEKRDLELRFAKAEDAYEAGAKKEEICAVLFR